MTRIATNAQLTNQGRADLQRSPTSPQIAFNQNGDSQISALHAVLATIKDGKLEPDEFATLTERVSDPGEFEPTRLSLFLWMTDRVIASWADQFYSGAIQPQGGGFVFENLTTNANRCVPTNGMAGLFPGVTCTPTTPISGYGQQSVLAYGSGANALAVRGTPMLLELTSNGFWTVLFDSEQSPKQPRITVTAFSESLLSGRHRAEPCAVLPSNEIDIYGSTGAGRGQIILSLPIYILGQYWLTDNVVGIPGLDYDIVGVYTQPPFP